MTAGLTCGGDAILSGQISLPRWGGWYADLTLDTTTVPTGQVQIQSEDGTLTMMGTALFGGVYQAHVNVRVEAGGGGVDRIIPQRYYYQPNLRTIVNDMLRDAGENLDSSVDPGLLSATINAWTRRQATFGSCIGDLTRFALPQGTVWRILTNGNVWFGQDMAGAEVAVDDFVTMDEQPSELLCTIATEIPAAKLIPGVLFQYDDALPAARVALVEHEIAPDRTRSTIWFSDPVFGDRASYAISRSLSQVLAPVRYGILYGGTVTGQNADGTVNVQVDPPSSQLTLGGCPTLPNLTNVPILVAGPQVTVQVSSGSRVALTFEGGSPGRPVVVAFEGNAGTMTGYSIANGSNGVAREGDSVNGGTVTATAPSGGGPVTFTYTPAGGGSPVVGATLALTGGQISSGSSKVKAG